MTLRLSDLVVGGELFNTKHYSVHGWVQLRGQEHALHLELTGNCAPDLAGWHPRLEEPLTFADRLRVAFEGVLQRSGAELLRPGLQSADADGQHALRGRGVGDKVA